MTKRFDWPLFCRAVRMLLKGRMWKLLIGAAALGLLFGSPVSALEQFFLRFHLGGGISGSVPFISTFGCVTWVWFALNKAFGEERFNELPGFGSMLGSEIRMAVPGAGALICMLVCLLGVLVAGIIPFFFLILQFYLPMGNSIAWVGTQVVVVAIFIGVGFTDFMGSVCLTLMTFEFLALRRGWTFPIIVTVTAPCFILKDVLWELWWWGRFKGLSSELSMFLETAKWIMGPLAGCLAIWITILVFWYFAWGRVNPAK
ncbi:MAG: hypothetical protein K1X53_16560 [Candidatus Sumerlaeaceae bacterium]|nr:hypothetical protein [Candidatus Sumerlaeaceae bacterium]